MANKIRVNPKELLTVAKSVKKSKIASEESSVTGLVLLGLGALFLYLTKQNGPGASSSLATMPVAAGTVDAPSEYSWTQDGQSCVDPQGTAVDPMACRNQPRPALECPPGYVVRNEPMGGMRVCVPAGSLAEPSAAVIQAAREAAALQKWDLVPAGPSRAVPPFGWSADGQQCRDANGVAVDPMACRDQPRPLLQCPPGYFVRTEPMGGGRVCVKGQL